MNVLHVDSIGDVTVVEGDASGDGLNIEHITTCCAADGDVCVTALDGNICLLNTCVFQGIQATGTDGDVTLTAQDGTIGLGADICATDDVTLTAGGTDCGEGNVNTTVFCPASGDITTGDDIVVNASGTGGIVLFGVHSAQDGIFLAPNGSVWLPSQANALTTLTATGGNAVAFDVLVFTCETIPLGTSIFVRDVNCLTLNAFNANNGTSANVRAMSGDLTGSGPINAALDVVLTATGCVDSDILLAGAPITSGGDAILTATDDIIVTNPGNNFTLMTANNAGCLLVVDGACGLLLLNTGQVTAPAFACITVNAGGFLAGGGGFIDLVAAQAVFTANGGGNINLCTTVGTVTANTTGTITLCESNALVLLNVGTLQTPSLSTITTGGNLTGGAGIDLQSVDAHLTANNNSLICLDTVLGTLDADTTGNVIIREADSIVLETSGALQAPCFFILTANGCITGCNGVDLTARRACLTANGGGQIALDTELATVTANTTGNIVINDQTCIQLASIGASQAPGTVTVNAGGSITGSAGTDVTSTSAILNAGNAVCVDTNVATLTATAPNSINVLETDAVRLQNVASTNGCVTVTNLTGNMNVVRVSAGKSVRLSANGGSILDAHGDPGFACQTGTHTNIIAGANSRLRAAGVIGLLEDPLDANIQNGTLTVSADSQLNNVSVDINGVVFPSNTLLIENVPPGLVIFNNRIIGGGNAGQILGATAGGSELFGNAALTDFFALALLGVEDDMSELMLNYPTFFTRLLLWTVDEQDVWGHLIPLDSEE